MKVSRTALILALEPGKSLGGIPIRSLRTIRSAAYDLGVMYGRKYTVNADRETLTVTITRVS